MVTDNKKPSAGNKGNKRKQYRPHNKPVKKKGSYPLRPGVQGFFITCDGGRERQASHEAINVIDSFYEELVHGNDTSMKKAELPNKPLNKKIRFTYSDDDDDDEEDDKEEKREEDGKDDSEGEEEEEDEDGDETEGEDGYEEDNDDEGEVEAGKAADDKEDNKSNACPINEVNNENPVDENKVDGACGGDLLEKKTNSDEGGQKAKEPEEPPAKKQCTEMHASKSVVHEKVEEKSVDRLIEEELRELGDKSKRRFFNLDSGCNGVVFVQMRKRDGEPSPKDIIQHMMQSAASTRKHMSRFILRVLPVEVACYASEEEISRAIAPVVAKYFPADTQNPQKFAVLYEARANSGIERLKIIDAVAKSVPGPHKVDLSNPDKTILVEIVKTVCLIGVVEKYKELAKYNLRQLTSPK